ncbi:ABC transporter permease [Spiroplasma endosymbiont of Anurida maritima]|uniref:FtsX-like permease family protein n=1 Tax=Spiroplasma endosymbiont of Anurida maritima TaxID=2967972 RepID=UPI0036D38808
MKKGEITDNDVKSFINKKIADKNIESQIIYKSFSLEDIILLSNILLEVKTDYKIPEWIKQAVFYYNSEILFNDNHIDYLVDFNKLSYNPNNEILTSGYKAAFSAESLINHKVIGLPLNMQVFEKFYNFKGVSNNVVSNVMESVNENKVEAIITEKMHETKKLNIGSTFKLQDKINFAFEKEFIVKGIIKNELGHENIYISQQNINSFFIDYKKDPLKGNFYNETLSKNNDLITKLPKTTNKNYKSLSLNFYNLNRYDTSPDIENYTIGNMFGWYRQDVTFDINDYEFLNKIENNQYLRANQKRIEDINSYLISVLLILEVIVILLIIFVLLIVVVIIIDDKKHMLSIMKINGYKNSEIVLAISFNYIISIFAAFILSLILNIFLWLFIKKVALNLFSLFLINPVTPINIFIVLAIIFVVLLIAYIANFSFVKQQSYNKIFQD